MCVLRKLGRCGFLSFIPLLGCPANLSVAIPVAAIAVELHALFQSLYRSRPEMIDDGELVGDLFKVPDKWWGFEAFGRSDHPGACVGYVPPGFSVTMLKGTDLCSARYKEVHVVVQNDATNGLLKPTAFAINPREFSAPKIARLTDRLIGRLSPADLERMRSELVRLFVSKEDKHG